MLEGERREGNRRGFAECDATNVYHDFIQPVAMEESFYSLVQYLSNHNENT